MKQIKFFVMALAAMSMFSCSTEEAADATIPDGGDGSAAYAQFTLKMPDATRGNTAADDNAIAMEKEIKDVYVYVMSKGVVEKKIELVKPTGANTEWKSAPIKLAAGTKQMVAIVNGGTKFTFRDEGKTPFRNVADSLTGNRDNLWTYVASPTATDKSRVLFSSKVEVYDVIGPTQLAPTKVDLQVTRVVSKIIVRDEIRISDKFTKVTYEKTGNTTTNGAMTRAAFVVVAEAQTSYLFQAFTAGVPINPTAGMSWKEFPATAADAGLSYRALAKDGALVKEISGLYNAGGPDRGGQYVVENVAGKATSNKNVTQLFVRVALKAKSYTLPNDTEEPNTLPETATVPTYYVLKHNLDMNKSKIFKGIKDWTDWKNANPSISSDYEDALIPYTNGYNYYQVAIKDPVTTPNEATMFSTIRNTIYNVKLGELKGFGNNGTGQLVDPDQPVEPEAWLQATVTIMPWTFKEIDAPLQ